MLEFLKDINHRFTLLVERLKHLLLFAFFGLLFMACGLFIASDLPTYARLAVMGTRTDGVLLHVYSDTKLDDTPRRELGTRSRRYVSVNCEFEYSFKVDGQEYQNRCPVWTFQAEKTWPDSSIPVTYLESDPGVSRFGGPVEIWWEICLWQLPGLLMFLLGLLSLGAAFKRGPTITPRPGSKSSSANLVDDYPF